MTGASADRPLPWWNEDTAFFWQALAAGRLVVQRCDGCSALRHPPQPMCPSCGSLEAGVQEVTGRGRVHSYTVHHHPPIPGFESPYAVVLVDLEEGVRMVVNVPAQQIGRLEIGRSITIQIEEPAPGSYLPVGDLAPEQPSSP